MPLTSIKLRVTDYARVSTDHLEQKKSLQNQVEHFEQYIKENPNWTYVGGYVDDGITGTSDVKRDNFMKMIEDARSGKFDLIVTKEISRFSRNTLDSIKYTRELLSYGVAVLFVNDNINTVMPDSELRLTIMASMAQDEIRRLSERVKFGMNRAIERGEILGNDLLYGYKKDKDTKVILHVARCHAQKNQDLLIDGFNQIVAEGRNVILLIIGLGYDSERGLELKEKACRSVHFLGTRTNIGDYMLNADVFTLSSLAEGMPITLLEAMLCGVPMVSTPVCGAVDVINGKNGLLSKDFSKAEYCKALEKVIDDNEYYKQNAKADMSETEYTIKKCAEKYMEFYKLRF